MKRHQKTIGKNDEWLTPVYIKKALFYCSGWFDLDPCDAIDAPPQFRYSKFSYNINRDGLNTEWIGRIWLNPPFNRYERPEWMAKMAEHNNGIMLVPAACETEAFYKHVWGKASGILFLKGRPHFCYVDGTEAKANSGCTICLVSYGEYNLKALQNSGLGFTIDLINNPTNN